MNWKDTRSLPPFSARIPHLGVCEVTAAANCLAPISTAAPIHPTHPHNKPPNRSRAEPWWVPVPSLRSSATVLAPAPLGAIATRTRFCVAATTVAQVGEQRTEHECAAIRAKSRTAAWDWSLPAIVESDPTASTVVRGVARDSSIAGIRLFLLFVSFSSWCNEYDPRWKAWLSAETEEWGGSYRPCGNVDVSADDGALSQRQLPRAANWFLRV